MTAPPESDAAQRLRNQAIGALLWKDPKRILGVVEGLRGTDAVIECRLRGGSMGIAIPAGSALRIHIGRTPPYRLGEVVAFAQGSGICVHRIAYFARNERVRDFLITQGDACHYPDSPIRTKDILGPITEYRLDGPWLPVGLTPSSDRASSSRGRMLLNIVATLMETDVRLARLAASSLRLRKEQARAATD